MSSEDLPPGDDPTETSPPSKTIETTALPSATIEMASSLPASATLEIAAARVSVAPSGRTPPPPKASTPPAEPRSPSRTSFIELAAERPARLQVIVVLILGLALLAIPLYLWRRPRAPAIGAGVSPADAGDVREPLVETSALAAVDLARPKMSPPKVISCQDLGLKKTPVDACDHLPAVESALVAAIEGATTCVPTDVVGELTVEYVLDVSFKRKTLNLTAPPGTRTSKNSKIISACQSAVKAKLHELSLESLPHAHTRYRISVTATYCARPRAAP
jgi:hypothetical protein